MNKFEKFVKPVLGYIGAIGATLMSIAYIVIVFVLINGFAYRQTAQTIVFAGVNAGVGLIICNFLRYQGVSFAKMVPANKEAEERYYGTKTKDKKTHSMAYFWVKSLIADVLVKGLSIVLTTTGLIYIVVEASNDWNLLLLAVVNLIMFICFGLLSLNGAYDYYNNTFVPYMNERIKEKQDGQNSDES